MVAREESISCAAELLHLTQSTLNRQLAQLEDEIGVKLLERSGKKITLTNEGQLLYRRAEEVVSLVDKAERELIELDQLIEGKITIGCEELAAFTVVSELLSSFLQLYPSVTIDIFTANSDLVKEQMDRGLLDIGLLLEPEDTDKYDFVRMPVQERWAVLMRPDDPLATKDCIKTCELVGAPLILPRCTNVQNEVVRRFGWEFNQMQTLFTSNLSTNSTMMVYAGLGRSVVIEGSLPFLDHTQLVVRPLFPELHETSVLVWKSHQTQSPVVRRFIEHVRCLLSME